MATSVSVRETVESLIDRLHESANVTSVFGEPIERDGKTVVPVARVAYGFGGGFGGDAEAGEGEGEGGGGGGGVSSTPAGALEITDDDTRFVRFADRKRLAGAVVAGLVIGLLLGRR